MKINYQQFWSLVWDKAKEKGKTTNIVRLDDKRIGINLKTVCVHGYIWAEAEDIPCIDCLADSFGSGSIPVIVRPSPHIIPEGEYWLIGGERLSDTEELKDAKVKIVIDRGMLKQLLSDGTLSQNFEHE